MSDNQDNSEVESLDQFWMQRALELAQQARAEEEVPVGAVLIRQDQILGEGWNAPIRQHDPTAHAEIRALRHAAEALGNYRLLDTTLYVTLEPCVMGAGAIIHARVKRVVIGAADPRTGAAGSVFDILNSDRHKHQDEMSHGVLADECGALLKAFFQARRNKNT